jgi:hypothetical protein
MPATDKVGRLSRGSNADPRLKRKSPDRANGRGPAQKARNAEPDARFDRRRIVFMKRKEASAPIWTGSPAAGLNENRAGALVSDGCSGAQRRRSSPRNRPGNSRLSHERRQGRREVLATALAVAGRCVGHEIPSGL